MNVFRTWGFNDKNVTYNPAGKPQYGGEGAGTTEVVFQRWDNGQATIDISPFDKVVDAAAKTGIKLLVAFTNNWSVPTYLLPLNQLFIPVTLFSELWSMI